MSSRLATWFGGGARSAAVIHADLGNGVEGGKGVGPSVVACAKGAGLCCLGMTLILIGWHQCRSYLDGLREVVVGNVCVDGLSEFWC